MDIKANQIINNWVYQSNTLIESRNTLTTMEHKIIRIFASLIKNGDTELTEYKIKITELQKLLKISRQNVYRELDKITDLMMSRYIKVKNKENPKDWDKYHLVKNCSSKKGYLTFRIDDEMIPFYLMLQQYTKYRLKNILEFKGKYSFRLYEMLKQYESLGFRKISIQDLREILEVEKSKYKDFSNIKQRILETSKKEIDSKTDISFEYKETRERNRVIDIEFKIKSKEKFETEEIKISASKKTLPSPKIDLKPKFAQANNFEQRKYDQEYFESVYEEL